MSNTRKPTAKTSPRRGRAIEGRPLHPRLAQIARATLGFTTLQSRNSDALDFREVSVWQVRQALQEAFEAGASSAAGDRAKVRPRKYRWDALHTVYTVIVHADGRVLVANDNDVPMHPANCAGRLDTGRKGYEELRREFIAAAREGLEVLRDRTKLDWKSVDD